MRQIRRNVFETNSSSTHSCCICTADEFERWRKGEFYVAGWGGDEFVTKAEAIEACKNHNYYRGELDDIENMDSASIDEILNDHEFYTYFGWFHDYEGDVTRYTTPGGEEIVVVCFYGYSG